MVTTWLYIYEIAEVSPQQQSEGNTTVHAVITLWESLTECQTIITFIKNSSAEMSWLPTDFTSYQQWEGVDTCIKICSNFQANHYYNKISDPSEFLF
jgi:hypothetical protein